MPKKKKTQLNPVARGFATTSQPSKRAIAEAQEAAAIAENEAAISTSGTTADRTASLTPNGDPSAVVDSTELDFEEQTWQDMVDRWQNKTDREILRTVQVIY
jgi:ATP-dependent RNA helicase DHX29